MKNHKSAIRRNMKKDGPTNSQLRGTRHIEITSNTVDEIINELRFPSDQSDGLTMDGIAVENYYTLLSDTGESNTLDEMYNTHTDTPFEELYNSHPLEAIDLYDYFDE